MHYTVYRAIQGSKIAKLKLSQISRLQIRQNSALPNKALYSNFADSYFARNFLQDVQKFNIFYSRVHSHTGIFYIGCIFVVCRILKFSHFYWVCSNMSFFTGWYFLQIWKIDAHHWDQCSSTCRSVGWDVASRRAFPSLSIGNIISVVLHKCGLPSAEYSPSWKSFIFITFKLNLRRSKWKPRHGGKLAGCLFIVGKMVKCSHDFVLSMCWVGRPQKWFDTLTWFIWCRPAPSD